ncbi:unnamed protein product [Urochloa humidicola]
MAPPPRPSSALMDELVEEVALRIPPDDPACLLRGALVCKSWWRIVSDPGFRRRYARLPLQPRITFHLRRDLILPSDPCRSLELPRHRRPAWPRPPPCCG